MHEIKTDKIYRHTTLINTRARLSTFISGAGEIMMYLDLPWDRIVAEPCTDLIEQAWTWPIGHYADIDAYSMPRGGKTVYLLTSISNVSRDPVRAS